MNEAYGIPVSLSVADDSGTLRAQLQRALDIIATYRPTWIERMLRNTNTLVVRDIPGLRARLEERSIALNPLLLSDFTPAQIAASIVHEATHAHIRAKGLWHRMSRAREERMGRASELRLGLVLVREGVEGAGMVVSRARAGLAASDEDVAPLASPAGTTAGTD